jgi:flagellar hook protein FlgE
MFLLGWPADSSGDIGNVSRNSGLNLEPVNIATSQFTASPTTSMELGINLPADATNAGGSGDPYSAADRVLRQSRPRADADDGVHAVRTLAAARRMNGMSSSSTAPAIRSTSLGRPEPIVFDDTAANGGRIDSATASGGVSYNAATGKSVNGTGAWSGRGFHRPTLTTAPG